MKPAPFAYKKARSLEEAVALLGEHKEARLLAGGQSLIATLEALIDLGEDLLAGRQRAQVAGNGHRLWPYRGDGLGTFRKIGRIGCRQHRLRALTREGRR